MPTSYETNDKIRSRFSKGSLPRVLLTLGLPASILCGVFGFELFSNLLEGSKSIGTLACKGVYFTYLPEASSKLEAIVSVTPELEAKINDRLVATDANVEGGPHGAGNLYIYGSTYIDSTKSIEPVSEKYANDRLDTLTIPTKQIFSHVKVNAMQYGQTAICPTSELKIDPTNQTVTSNNTNTAYFRLP
jgi:hypothetical protein